MIIPYFITVLLLILGVLSFLLPHFIKVQKGYFFYGAGLFIILSVLALNKQVVIINDEENIDQQTIVSVFGNFSFKFKNGDSTNMSLDDNLIFNNTNHQLIVDGIKYSTTISSNDYSNITIAIIPPYSSINLNKKVDYFFTYPPGTISVKNSHSETRYWLHRDLTQP